MSIFKNVISFDWWAIISKLRSNSFSRIITKKNVLVFSIFLIDTVALSNGSDFYIVV